MSISDLGEGWINWLVTLGAVGGLIATYFRGVLTQNEKMNKAFAEQDKKMHEVQLELRTTKVQLEVFLQVINKELPKVLVSAHTPDIDDYMWKRMKGEPILDEEKVIVFKLMQEVIDGDVEVKDGNRSKDFRAAYAIQMATIAAELAKEKEKRRGLEEYKVQKEELEAKANERKKRKWRIF